MIQQELQNPLATELLKEDLPEGDLMRIDFDGNDFVFEHVGNAETVVT